jgi:type I restriction-modification system DNA methylase subunit
MLAENHQRLADKIWAVANKLRGPYRPPQYRKVMLPLIVLRCLDCVLEPTKDQVPKQVQASWWYSGPCSLPCLYLDANGRWRFGGNKICVWSF